MISKIFQGKEQADLVVRILKELPVIDAGVEEVFRKATLDLVEVYLSQVFIFVFSFEEHILKPFVFFSFPQMVLEDFQERQPRKCA